MTAGLIRTAADWVPVLRRRKAELQLTNLELDELAGLAPGHAGAILCGKKKPKADTLMRLCAALGLAVMTVVESK
jgi:transcriptional regulator with XRE-family HTH domain